ncbi:MAG: hypothetical protein R3E79_32250 [Caldilineaceae bacterium]
MTIQQVQDSRFGDISSSCLPALPALLVPQTHLCQFTRTITGEADGTTFATTVSVSGIDDDAQPVADFDLGNLDMTDVLPCCNRRHRGAQSSIWKQGALSPLLLP